MSALRSLFALLLLLLVPASVGAQGWDPLAGQERIISFVSSVTVEPDGDLDVTETIKVNVLNQQINHGIYRDFPTSYKTQAGQRMHVGFEVLAVERDGQPEPFSRESLSNGVRVRIGSADVTVPPAEHTYVIHYRTSRQVYYGPDFDELYWNVTGNGWIFPIGMAEARIKLPKDAAFTGRDFWTGPQGATGKSAAVIAEQPGTIVFRTTAPLASYEGLTISAKFPKGVLEAPSSERKAQWWLEDWGALTAALAAIAGLAFYYFRAWAKVGRGPRAGTVVPNFSPPDDLTPAAVRYVARMGFDNRAFSAAMVWLGVKRCLHITEETSGFFGLGKTTILRRTDPGRPGETFRLPEPESGMYARLFSLGGTLELKQENHTTLQEASKALQDGLAAAYEDVTFRKNSDWAVYGLGLIVLAILGVAVVGLLVAPGIPAEQKFGPPLICFGLMLVMWWIGRTMPAGTGFKEKGSAGKGCFQWIALALLGVGALVSAVGTIGVALSAGAWPVLLPLVALVIGIPAFWWMYAPTVEGRALMDRIAGFKQYLSITEEERLDAMHPPEKTPELFERYLPYAIALDVENRWAEKFAAVLAAAAAAQGTASTIGWYTGSGNVWDDPQGFASSMGDSLSSTVSSASASPSSGGSGGGGSSGGGGGGGGGGGW